MPDPLVFFAPSGKRGRFVAGTPVLDAARQLGVDLDSVCGGRGICGRCAIEVTEGANAKLGIVSSPDHLTPRNAVEDRYGAKRGLPAGRRLGCQARLAGDAVVDVPPESQMHRQVVRKSADERVVAIDPVIRLHYVEVREPDMHDPASDLRRLQQALTAQWGLTDLHMPLAVLAGLQKALRAGAWAVTVAVRAGRDIVAVFPGLREASHGIAVDIGSTTLAAHLVDLATGAVLASAGAMNPQIRFGEDLMSRVSHVMMTPGGETDLTSAVRGALADLVRDVAGQTGLAAGDVLEMVAVGNPVMHHLLLGIDPTELGGAPFALAVDAAVDVPARDLGLPLAPGAFVHCLPLIAGHVGADTAGVVLAEAPWEAGAVTLIVDVGTNAEIVLGNRQRLLACSSPTGPAFEGAQVSSGQRAAPGAIERIRIDPATLEPRYKVIGCDLWSDDPGFSSATAATGITGICGSGIIEAVAEMRLADILTPDGVIDGSNAARSLRIIAEGRTFSYLIRDGMPRIAITQADVRAIQLAKAALYAGIRLLMDRYGVATVDSIRLAGAFGSHIDVAYAMILGLIPDCDLTQVSSAGNAAGTGARIALLNAAARARIADVVRGIEKIETALEPAFQDHFVGAMAIPHTSDPFPNLEAALGRSLARGPAEGGSGGRERRRRRG